MGVIKAAAWVCSDAVVAGGIHLGGGGDVAEVDAETIFNHADGEVAFICPFGMRQFQSPGNFQLVLDLIDHIGKLHPGTE